MPRPRKFDEDQAVEAAMRAFWAQGYEATSTQDLCEATGLGRSSIYNTFASKHDLFRRALTRYVELMSGAHLAVLRDEKRPALERVRAWLAMVIDGEFENRRDGRSVGCFAVNTTVEMAGRDEEADRVLHRDLELRLDALRSLISAG
ncbi:helix-turn-helix transcriptional regulator, partial [Amycolatopsis rhizosphaerae]